MPPARPSDRPITPERPTLSRAADTTRQAALAIAWLLAVAIIALGAAGIVAGMDTPRADGGDRTGRSARGDATVDAALDGIEAELRALAGDIDALGGQGRVILASLTANDIETATAASARGTELVAAIDARAASIRDALDAVPLVGTPAAAYEISPASVDRHAAYRGALDTTTGIGGAWTGLTVGSLSASRMSQLLAAHDAAVAAAAEAGRDADYDAALARLDEADSAIAEAKTMRDRLAATVDVTTLDEWLDRSGDYDAALRRLYVAVERAGGRVTSAVRSAMREESRAKSRLPPDTRSLVLIMSDIGQGGMNDSAAAIQTAHDDLLEAIAPPVDEAPAIEGPVPVGSAPPS
jgi:hypothetical protein